MNLPQFQIILQKINALDKNIMMDGKISSIEKDLMKAYVSQLYEACVGDDASKATSQPKEEAVVQTPTPVVEPVPTAQVPVQNTPTPAVQQPIAPPPTQQPVADHAVTPPPAPVQQPVQQVTQQPVQQVAEPVQPVTPTPTVNPTPQVENKLKDLNDRIAANTKTVADKLSNPQGKSLNERLADKNVGKTFNDRFTKDDTTASSTDTSAPKMVVIPDSIKHLDNSSISTPVTRPAATVTPPPPPPVEPTPVAKVTPTATPSPVRGGSVNINEIYALFDDEQASEAAGKWGSTPIQDLSKSIGLNDKISMIKELFNDDHQAFNNSLTQLNGLGNFAEAKDYMMRNLVTVFKWNEGGKLERAKQLINLVRRRYK